MTLVVPATRAAAAGVRVSIACGALGVELALCREAAEEWAQQTGNSVSIVNTPNSSSDRFSLYVQLLASRSPEIDVLQIDVVWPGMLGSHLLDLGPAFADRVPGMFPALTDNNTVDGRLVAIPWYVDAGVLYYRRDLLEKHGIAPPQSWDEMTRAAGTIQTRERAAGQSGLWGFVFQGKPYEGLTCDALEWIASWGGGSFVDADGDITVNNPLAATALRRAASWIGTIAPRGVLNYDEESARGVFQTGNAVFMRNWPYAWALAQGEDSPVRGRVGVIALPKGGPDGRHVGTLGGWQLAVSRYSRHPQAATDLVRHLTSARIQKMRAIRGAYNPTIMALYHDPEILAANPFFEALLPSFVEAIPRPARQTGAHYNQVSAAIWRTVHAVLSGSTDAPEGLEQLQQSLDRIRHRARW
ncbi:MAG: ABC transporter substrate-binding protein [Steroidobacteraceae bacterium]